MTYDLLLREGRINGMTLANRIITGPMERGLANRDGTVSQRYIDYLVERARGGASLIMVESTYVDARGMGHLFQLGCHGDHVIPGLTNLAEALHREGARVGLELYFGGRQTPSVMSQQQPLAPSSVPCSVLDPTPIPRAMTTTEIADMIGSFAEAARRVLEAGIDMIHLHGAHGYLLGSFLSPFSNRRQDGYGGDAGGRARFPLEVLRAVRDVVGPSYPIGYRMSAAEYVPGGLTIDDTTAFSQRLVEGGIDLIDVSGGIYESASKIIQGPEAPAGGFVANAAAIKSAVGDAVPVSVTQRLNTPDFANEVMARHGIDFISLSRAFHADPHFVRKLREDRAADILPCMACHHCTNLLEADQPAGCAANPWSTFERQRRGMPSGNRRIVVVGGGPAGMHAARILARHGHRVTLHERAADLGGQMRYSSRVAADYGNLVSWLVRQVHALGVEVHTGSDVDVATLQSAGADAIVIATGAGPGLDLWRWQGQTPRFDLFSAMDRPAADWHDKAVILGGDSESCATGLFLARQGVEVHIIDPKPGLADDRLSPGRNILIDAMLAAGATAHLETTVELIGEGWIDCQHAGKSWQLDGVGAVVVGGRTARNGLYEALLAAPPSAEVFAIGDAVRPRDVYAASHDATDVAERISRGTLATTAVH